MTSYVIELDRSNRCWHLMLFNDDEFIEIAESCPMSDFNCVSHWIDFYCIEPPSKDDLAYAIDTVLRPKRS